MPATLQERFDALKAKRAEADTALAPLREKQSTLRAKIVPLEGEIREVNEAIKKVIAESRLYAVDQEIAQLARALGAKSMKAGGA